MSDVSPRASRAAAFHLSRLSERHGRSAHRYANALWALVCPEAPTHRRVRARAIKDVLYYLEATRDSANADEVFLKEMRVECLDALLFHARRALTAYLNAAQRGE